MKLLVAVLAIGCGGPQPAAPPPSPAPSPTSHTTCKQAIDHAASIASNDVEPERRREEAENLVKHCVADGWSDAAIACLAGAATEAANEQCVGMLTQAQIQALSAGDDPKRVAAHDAKKYAFEAYPQWAVEHPDKACPGALAELREFTSFDSDNDPWGHPYRMMCGPSLPPGAKGVAIQSAGPDGQFDTADDVRSWE